MSAGSQTESTSVAIFREWLQCKGAYVHPALRFVKEPSGMAVYTAENMPCDSKVISCPFTLAITPDSSKSALSGLTLHSNNKNNLLEVLSERELICTYLVVHWLQEEEERDGFILTSEAASRFGHLPYLHTLPPADVLRTSLHFNEKELSLLRGSNLYGATVDRISERQMEWERCRTYAGTIRPDWETKFSWQRYLSAATYLSSRAFPSTILSPTPSLISTDSSHPILLPAVDSLNHARAHRVSWMIDLPNSNSSSSVPSSRPFHNTHQVSLIIHKSTPAHAELFNNYGPKPNSELILGYGFSLPANPDDTIVLKVGGQPGKANGPGRRWEVGRDALGVEGLWEEMKAVFADGPDTEEDEGTAAEWEIELEAAEALKDMAEHKLAALPHVVEAKPEDVRRDVLRMIQHYIEGQEDILRSLSIFADTKRESALTKAREEGVELVFEPEQDDST